MIAVLDACAAIGVVLDRPECSKIFDSLSKADLVVSPELFSAEITNVFWKLNKVGELDRGQCEILIEKSLALVDDLIPMSELSQEVFASALVLNHKVSAYDMFYAVIARRYNATLLTVDKKLKEAGEENETSCLGCWSIT